MDYHTPTVLDESLGSARRFVSFEALFALFLFAGVYKAWAPFAWIPVDLTALLGGLAGLVGLRLWIQRGFPRPPRAVVAAALFGLFVLYALLSGLWSPSRVYYAEKAFKLASATTFSFVGGLAIAQNPTRTRRFFAVVTGFALLITVGALVSAAPSMLRPTTTPEPLGTTYLIVGRAIGFGVVILTGFLLFRPLETRERGLVAGAIAVSLLTLVGLGGRGPMVATGVSMAALVCAAIASEGIVPTFSRRMVVAVLGGGAVLGGLLLTVGRSIRGVGRFLILLEGPGQSLGSRLTYYTVTPEMWYAGNRLLGQGLGSWPIAMGRGDEAGYPHNIILELLFELGLVGLALFGALLVYGGAVLVRGWLAHRRPESVVIGALCLFMLLNAMVTGDLNENRYLFAVLGLLCYRPVAGRVSPSSFS
ncbi:O-antigen ligase family protein [Halalkalicoccus subterraneus]|uniref:O-antigen ligase family protein n=1 Tax=Halalkalicoccus subterraneus TaxID=2675002 RepID=UPI000EFAEAB2|nr:O-antigen ligase family protein [Halalkalicoccus subterraneus]